MSRDQQRLSDYLAHILEAIEGHLEFDWAMGA